MHGFYHEFQAMLPAHLCYYYVHIKADQTLYLIISNNWFTNFKLQYIAQRRPLPADANSDEKGKLTVSKLKQVLGNISIV